jgi:chromosome segregation ATPase
MKPLLCKLAFGLVIICLSGQASLAQQPANNRRPPRLTTDDVRPPAEQPAVETKEAGGKPEDGAKAADAADPKTGQPKPKASDEELAWRDRMSKARDKAKQLEKAAEEGELRITALRNELGASGQSARQRNDTAAEMDQAGRRLIDLKTQSRAAADDAAQLADYGKQKGFSEAEELKATSEEGKPNEDYYRAEFQKLKEAVETAQRRVALYDNRVRDLNQQLTTNSGGRDKSGHATGGDNFYGAQLQKDRDDALQQLSDAKAAQSKAQSDLDALFDNARRAGVPPGLFR